MRLTIILLLVVLIALSGFILRQLHQNDQKVPIVTRDYVAPTVARELEQPDPPITAPKRDFRSTVSQLVPQLASDDADTRSAALDVLLSLPGDAQEAVESAAQASESPSAAREALQRSLPILQKRAARAQRIRQERDQLGRALLDAYNRYGHHDASWDDRARKIIPAFFALGPMQDRTAQQEAAVMKIFDRLTEYAHCNDSFVQYVYGCALVELQWGNATRIKAANSMDAASRDNRSMPAPWPDLFLAGCPTWRGDFFYAGGPADPSRLGPMFDTILNSKLLSTESKLACAEAILQDDRDSRHRIILFRTRPADVEGDFKLLHDAMEKALPDRPEPLLLAGFHAIGRAWDARGDDPSQVTEKGRKLFKQHMTEAKEALEKAYELDPADPRTPVLMLSVGLGLSESRGQMDLWYRRAIETDPDNYQAMQLMLTYLEPRWYGNREDLLSFAKACRDTHNYRGRMPLAIAEAQERLANYESDPGQYLREPDVWGQIRSSYESYLTLFPNDRLARTRYLRVAVLTDNWPQANEQCEYLGDHPWPGFYGDSDYQAIRKQAAQASSATSQPATRENPE